MMTAIKKSVQAVTYTAVACLFAAIALAQSNGADSSSGGTSSQKACIPAWHSKPWNDIEEASQMTMIRGADGFYYLGGVDALYRVEGGRTRTWYIDSDDPDGLPAANILTIATVEEGLWLGTSQGLVFFDFKQEMFRPVSFREETGRTIQVLDLLVFDGRLYVADMSGLHIVELETGALLDEVSFGGAELDVLTSELHVFDNQVIAGTNVGAFVISEDGATARIPTDLTISPEAEVFDMDVSPDGELWMIGPEGLMKTRSVDQPATLMISEADERLPGDQYAGISFDQLGRLWIGGTRGLAVWEPDASGPVRCRMVSGSDTDRTTSVTFVEAGLGPFIVYGSWGAASGRTRMAPLAPETLRIMTGESQHPGLPRTEVWSGHYGPEGRLFLATANGLFRQRTTGSTDFIAIGESVINGSRMTGLANGPDGKVWAVGYEGIFIVDELEVEELQFPITVDGPSDRFHTSYQARNFGDKMLVSSTSGLLVFDAATYTLERFFRSRPGRFSRTDVPTVEIGGWRILHIDILDEDVYATGDGAVFRLNVETGDVLASTLEARERREIQSSRLNAAAALSDGTVFIATDNGVIKSNRDFNSFELINQIGSIRLGPVFGVVRDQDDQIWIATENRDLFRYSPSTDLWETFSIEDGLLAQGTTQLGLAMWPDGRLIHSNTGLTAFDPTTLKKGLLSPETLIVRDRDSGRNLSTGDALELRPGQRGFSFEFEVPGLIDPEQYRVTLDLSGFGVEGRKRLLDLDERLNIEGLAPGSYELSLQLLSIRGATGMPVKMTIDVIAPWWKTQSGQVLAILVLALIIVLALARRSAMVEERFRLVGAERERIAQNIHDTHLQEVYGALLLGQAMEADENDPDKQQQIGRINTLLREASSSARTSVRELFETPAFENLGEAVRHLEQSLAAHLKGNFSFRETGTAWELTEKRCFFLARATREAVYNAAKHARADNISVSISWKRSHLIISIMDDGIGFDPSLKKSEGGGFGLEGMKRLVSAANAKVTLQSEPGEGTSISIRAGKFGLPWMW